MDSVRWERIQLLFHEAANLDADARAGFLAAACGADDGLRQDVLRLLEADADPPLVLEGLAAAVTGLVRDGEPATTGTRIGRYVLGPCIGEGGMGVVYRASRAEIGGDVAIKMLRDAWVSPSRRSRFAEEQRTLARLTHPAIARLYDADTLTDGTPWFAMEYVEGEPITAYCQSRRLPVRARLDVFRRVCEAVLHAHQQLIVHRDLKPSNIYIAADGQVKLLDFGIAKSLAAASPASLRTRTVVRAMTPEYAAPEQIRGAPVTVQTDVYALGVVLYELLTDRLPFAVEERTPGEVEHDILEGDPPRPSAAAAGFTRTGVSRTAWADLDVLCLTAMHRDPAHRYATVDALARDIDNYLADRPLDARAGALLRYKAVKFVRRHWRGVGTAAAVAVVLGGVVVFYTSRLDAARSRALLEAERTRRIEQFMLGLFEADDAGTAPSEDLRVASLLERGVQKAALLDGQPDLRAELHHTLGTIFQQLGRYDRADEMLRAAVDERRGAFGPDSVQAADSELALGLLRLDESNVEEAESIVRHVRDRLPATLAPNDPLRGRAAAALGKVLRERSAYDEAALLLEGAIGIFERDPAQERDLAAALTSLANTRFYAGRLDESAALNHRVLELDRRLFGDRHPDVAHDLLNLGNIDESRGRYEAAIGQYRQALAILTAWFGTNHPETASAMTILAQPLTAIGQYDESAALLTQALATQEHVYGPTHARVAFALNALGGVEFKRGHLEASEQDYRRALAIYTAVNGPRHVWVGLVDANLGGVATARGDPVLGETLLRKALDIYAGALSADHLNVGVARIKLGHALLAQRRYADAVSELTRGEGIVAGRSPSNPWLKPAREDLAAAYEALHEPDKAARYRAIRSR